MWIFVVFIILLIVMMFWNYKIKWRTFFRKGFRPTNDKFGVYVYCGKQGKGKTYSVVEFLIEQSAKGVPIYANLKSLDNEKIDYTYFEGFGELLQIKDHDCIIVYDEIFSALDKFSKINRDVLNFLSQMRKRRIVFVTTAQEWLEINLTLRRYCRYQIQCNMIDIKLTGVLIKKFYDAEQMVWDKDMLEFIAPLDSGTVSKCNIEVANSYDTYEQVFLS